MTWGWIGIPIVLTVGLIDPLLGEMKNFKVRGSIRFLVGFAATFVLWASCVYVGANDSSFAWTMVPIMTFTCVLVEYPDIPSVDDNLLLQLVPLAIVLTSAAHWNGPL